MSERIARALTAAAPDIAKGVRAAIVTLVPFYFSSALHRPELAWMALGGWLGTLADPGGSRPTRAKTLAAFALAGAPITALFTAMGSLPQLVPFALAAVAFSMSLLRAVDGTAGSVGTLLIVLAAIAGGRSMGPAAECALWFGAGALQAVVLSSVVWPVWTHLPVRRAVASVYRELAAYADDALPVIDARVPAGDAQWTALVREHHRRIRAAIEEARAVAIAVRARRDGETRFGGNVRALLGEAEAQFPLLVTLVQELEAGEPNSRVEHTARLAAIASYDREVERALFARAITSRAIAHAPARRSVAPYDPASLVDSMGARLELASRDAALRVHAIDEPVDESAGGASTPPRAQSGSGGPRSPARAMIDVLGALRDALSPRSITFQHAVRAAAAAILASALGNVASRSHAYWVTLTALAILQPYPGATMKRAGERVVGTILGSLVAVAITMSVRSPLALAVLMFPLSIAAVATRPRSYRLFTFFLTPVFVLLAERHPGDLWTAAERASDAVLGGIVAFVCGVLVFPSSEKERLPDALMKALDAVSAYANAVLSTLDAARGAQADERILRARREAGVAFGAAESSLERLLAEPNADAKYAGDAMLLLTYARRLGAAFTTVFTLAANGEEAHVPIDAVRAYVSSAVDAAKARVADRAVVPPAGSALDLLSASARSIDLALERAVSWAALIGAIARGESIASTKPTA